MEKISIAIHQLNRSIEMFLDDKDYICSITLSGASEEILGKAVEYEGEINSLNELIDGLKEISGEAISSKDLRNEYLNNVRNSIKHYSNIEDSSVTTNWEAQAVQLIARCCSNVIKLKREPSYQMSRFIEWSGI
ncbi:hypothetical protein [Pseudoalteromonas sp. Z9A4]|uniref:hypothetical protein n=1 Tax=Pseudoalteromonas sp. Z9A4 TaxID=2686353 RepID=UPI00140B82B9|nr:hypothetical protein [Pseudoalteromonas sp. Z9A4]